MILYTTMPYELVFPYEAEQFHKQQVVSYKGIPMLVEMSGAQYAQVVRILSSDPQHFMDEQICPGTKISFANLDGWQSLN
ncbi:YlzJ-like family protein [Neobacillus dielmonensis]|uniref:YlzJ-like family protein n=1 Tax=Neobacillus dielmonensis TaxID=1347369 RepID=UPI0005A7A6A6|nr:YlzJ-like family protein [Neobacillus dielmonensis]